MNVFQFHSPIAEFLILTVVLTFLLLLFGEIMPKIYSAQKTLVFCRFAAPGITFLPFRILSDGIYAGTFHFFPEQACGPQEP